jgi:hypothetical protein
VLHNIKDLVIHKRGTLWIKDFDIFREWQTEAKQAIRGPHFAGLLEVVERANRPGGKWSADDFAEAGCFGPFLSLLGLIEQDGASKESGGSAVTYYDHTPPVAWRTRSHQEECQYETPTKGIRRVQRAKINQNVNDSFKRMGFEDTPGTSESPQQPPSGQGSVAKYEQAKIDVQDEQTVNQCLINLMLPITWPLQISGNIDPQRQAFKFPIDDRKGYEARVDGIFTKPTLPTDVIGILEVKKGLRTHEVRVQEAAQMVAFMRKSADQGSNDSEVKRCVASAYVCFALLIQPSVDGSSLCVPIKCLSQLGHAKGRTLTSYQRLGSQAEICLN